MKFCIFVYIASILHVMFSTNADMIDSIVDILKHRNTKFVHLYTCFSVCDKVRISKLLNQDSIFTTFNVEHTSFDHLGIVLDISCENSANILRAAQRLNLFQARFKWIIFDSQNNILINTSSIHENFNKIHFRLDSEIWVALTKRNSMDVFIYDVYTIVDQMKITEVGFWTPQSNLRIIYKQSKYYQRKNFTGTFLRVGVVNTQPLQNESLDSNFRNVARKDGDNLNRVNYILFMHLQEMHNFTYNKTLRTEWFGNSLLGIDGGLAQLLYENHLDIAAASGSVRTDRLTNFDFIFPVYPYKGCFIFRVPRSSGAISNEFLKPFVNPLWYLILVTIAVFCVILKLHFVAERKLFGRAEENSWHSALILLIGGLCQQGACFVPKPTSGRLTLINMLIMSLLLYNYYVSSIVSILLLSLPTPLKSISDLTKSQLDVGLEDIIYTKAWFKVANDTDVDEFYNKKVLIKNASAFVTIDEGIKRVKEGGYAYHTELSTGYASIVKTQFEPYQICELGEINFLPPQVLWLMSKKNGEYAKMQAIGYSKMLQSGITARILSTWMTKKPACLANAFIVQVGMQHLLPAFLVLCFAAGLALIILLGEILVTKYFKNR